MLTSRVTDANSLFSKLSDIGNTVIILLISLAVIYIVWNAVQFIMNAASEEKGKYRDGMIWGIVGLAVILSIWGLVAILTNTFGTNNRYSSADSDRDVQGLILKGNN